MWGERWLGCSCSGFIPNSHVLLSGKLLEDSLQLTNQIRYVLYWNILDLRKFSNPYTHHVREKSRFPKYLKWSCLRIVGHFHRNFQINHVMMMHEVIHVAMGAKLICGYIENVYFSLSCLDTVVVISFTISSLRLNSGVGRCFSMGGGGGGSNFLRTQNSISSTKHLLVKTWELHQKQGGAPAGPPEPPPPPPPFLRHC